MKNFLKRILKYFCVPLVIFSGGIIFSVIFRIVISLCGSFSSVARVMLSITFILAEMFLLRNVPRRTLLISSLISCALSLAVQLLVLVVIQSDNSYFSWIYNNILTKFISHFNNIIIPIIEPIVMPTISQMSGQLSSTGQMITIISGIIAVLLPLIYVFSGFFNKIDIHRG